MAPKFQKNDKVANHVSLYIVVARVQEEEKYNEFLKEK